MSDTWSLRAEIEARNDEFMRASKRGDAAAVAAVYTVDAWLLPPGTDIIKGQARIEEFWRTRFQRIASVKLTPIDVIPLGPDAAREVGSSEIKMKGDDGQSVLGKYIVVWRQEAGSWKLESDMFNNNG